MTVTLLSFPRPRNPSPYPNNGGNVMADKKKNKKKRSPSFLRTMNQVYFFGMQGDLMYV